MIEIRRKSGLLRLDSKIPSVAPTLRRFAETLGRTESGQGRRDLRSRRTVLNLRCRDIGL